MNPIKDYKAFADRMVKLAQGFDFLDFAIFKLTIFAGALFIADIFPVILWLPFWVYLLIAVGGSVYLLRNFKWK